MPDERSAGDTPLAQLPPPAPSPVADHHRTSTTSERRALAILTLSALVAILWVARPVAIGVLLGTLIAFTLQPLYHRLRVRWQRPMLASLTCVAVVTVGFVATLGGIGYLIVARGVAVVHALIAALEPGAPAAMRAGRITDWLTALHLGSGDLVARLREAATWIASELGQVSVTIATFAFSAVLALFFMLLTVDFILGRWDTLTRRAEGLLPVHPRHTRALFSEFRSVGRSVLLGAVVTGLAQGLLAGVGYSIFRIPDAAFIGALTAIASLIPGVGTMLVWVPVGIWLIATGHVGAGVGELAWGTVFVVVIPDYVLRPRLVGGDGHTPSLLTFIALFGGVEAFGLIGLILGPVVMSVSLAVLRIYERESMGSIVTATAGRSTASRRPSRRRAA